MTLPRILIASPIRYRPECPEVLPAFLDALSELDWPEDRREFWFAVQSDSDDHGVRGSLWLFEFDDRTYCEHEAYVMPSHPDSRLASGPRMTGETQENIAFLRNKCFRTFQESDCDFCLMVDSDVVLEPEALRHMHAAWQNGGVHSTISLQLNNTPWKGGKPQTNACIFQDGRWQKVPYAEDGSVVEVHRSGACTLYPRAALGYRFHWSPAFREEHESMFDSMRVHGWKHYLIRDPSLCDHRMHRGESLVEVLEKVKNA